MTTLFDIEPAELSLAERSALAELETTIERGLATFVEVGAALLQIRDTRLYRQEYDTFDDYCRQRWGMSRRNADRLISAADVAENLRPVGLIPANEAQIRPLTHLEPEQQREVYQEAVETAPDGKVTAAHVEATVRRFVPANMAVHYSSATDVWSTPQNFFDLLDSEFAFELDVCATAENAKCSRWYAPEDDGLLQPWQGSCWMNPPYGSEIGKWIAKAYESAIADAQVVCLVPARTDTAWWWRYCIHGEIRFLRGRLKFGEGKPGAPFPSAVIIFHRGVPAEKAQTIWWNEWKPLEDDDDVSV